MGRELGITGDSIAISWCMVTGRITRTIIRRRYREGDHGIIIFRSFGEDGNSALLDQPPSPCRDGRRGRGGERNRIRKWIGVPVGEASTYMALKIRTAISGRAFVLQPSIRLYGVQYNVQVLSKIKCESGMPPMQRGMASER